jgi:hypothetical protein
VKKLDQDQQVVQDQAISHSEQPIVSVGSFYIVHLCPHRSIRFKSKLSSSSVTSSSAASWEAVFFPAAYRTKTMRSQT